MPVRNTLVIPLYSVEDAKALKQQIMKVHKVADSLHCESITLEIYKGESVRMNEEISQSSLSNRLKVYYRFREEENKGEFIYRPPHFFQGPKIKSEEATIVSQTNGVEQPAPPQEPTKQRFQKTYSEPEQPAARSVNPLVPSESSEVITEQEPDLSPSQSKPSPPVKRGPGRPRKQPQT